MYFDEFPPWRYADGGATIPSSHGKHNYDTVSNYVQKNVAHVSTSPRNASVAAIASVRIILNEATHLPIALTTFLSSVLFPETVLHLLGLLLVTASGRSCCFRRRAWTLTKID
ncbi:hypothetical protein GWI33_010392 [Rhynchophorus ferrugineus]|uniref:Uncharacterized protein n=1 Tax=Rhynchophorus ferrugineus TaxID=354439 RepID=A0A834MMB3_RHYFE|nr:hypothetical protein GWI33_010392 [Rhynchophorus ferrugineus]